MSEQVAGAPRRRGRGKPDPIDAHVGTRVRMRRTLLGFSQERLGNALGITFQQVQKYERGANRIGAGRLHQLSRVLDVPVAFFFDEIGGAAGANGQVIGAAAGVAEDQKALAGDPLARRETLELVRAYYRITDAKVRRRVFELTKSLANTDEPS